jgi:prepilin-type N-terminal cleavage/methylation domain-containing protein
MNRKRNTHGFTLIEMMIAMAIFATGSIYVYSTFAGVTRSSQSITIGIDLGSQNKRCLTRLFNELQATSLLPQDTDGLDATDPVAVFLVEEDNAAPVPKTTSLLVNRTTAFVKFDKDGTTLLAGGSKEQAREKTITKSKRIRFRKVIGYKFNALAGTILPDWSGWVSYFVDDKNHLMRQVEGKRARTIAGRVDALEAEVRPDGTILVTIISARLSPDGHGWKRYANSVTIHPKN